MKKFDTVALLLLILAGVNWGLYGLFEFNLVYYVFKTEWIERIFYIILGISGLYVACIWKDFGIRWATRNKKKTK
jgi:uncharacterized membrane protein YuzA (DUF378 family)